MAARLTATIPQAKADYKRQGQAHRSGEQYWYNPLSRTPMLDLGGGHVVVPQKAFLLDTMTPTGLFYAGIDAWGRTFADQLGHRVEAYVGRQLRTLDDVEVRPEIQYGRSHRKSIDWFVITPEAVILVECKSQRLPLDARAGGDTLQPELIKRIGKGRAQLNETHALVMQRHPAFVAIPDDRPMIGLLVTSDPLYLANSPFVTRHLPSTAVPTLTASLRELEALVTLPSNELGSTLLRIATDPEFSTWNLATALRDTPTRRNPLLEEAWDSLALVRRMPS
jgi:hypothetical protein